MGGDVLAAAYGRILTEEMAQAMPPFGEPRQGAVHNVEGVGIAQHDAAQGGQIVARPIAGFERLARGDAAAEHQTGVDARIADGDGGPQRTVVAELAEDVDV